MRGLFIVMAGLLVAADRPATGETRRKPTPASGPLRVSKANPRYFTDGIGRVVYLTGSHTWGNLCEYPPRLKYPPFDYGAYLEFLGRHHHNVFRLWAGDGLGHRPSLYVRTGPEKATDGEARVDLTRLNQKYFDRLRERVVAARDRGIYVGIMLFRPDMYVKEDWPDHLFNPANNVQGLSGDTNGDKSGAEAYDLSVPRITRIQEEYVRKVIDTVNDLDNVLYEIGNEGDKSSVEWQYHFIRFIKKYQAGKPKQHPVGMTGSGFDDETLFKSPADWISPCAGAYRDNPPGSDGSKVIIVDTDHLAFLRGDPWKCFLRGLQFIHMDTYKHTEKTSAGLHVGRRAGGSAPSHGSDAPDGRAAGPCCHETAR